MITPRSVSGIEVRKKKLGEIRMEQLKRQQTIGLIIGSLIADHCLDRCHLKDEICDQIHALLYASADNLRRLPNTLTVAGNKNVGHSFWSPCIQRVGLEVRFFKTTN